MRITTEIDGLDETIQALNTLAEEAPDELGAGLKIAGLPVVTALQTYPPPPPNSSYQRTYAYQRSIQSAVDVVGRNAYFAAWSDSPYEIYLRGNLEGYPGAYMHVGRWRTLVNIWETFSAVVSAQLQRRLEALISRLGL